MRPAQRREKILDLLRDRERLTVEVLADQLSISRETIRRDLTELAGRGLLRKFHGGATLPDIRGEGAFAVRMGEALAEKRAIARAAATLFRPGETLLVDTGSTTVLLAEELARREDLTIVTNSLLIAQILGKSPALNKVFVLGGAFNGEANETFGALTVEQIATFHTDHAVITIGALNGGGALDFNLEEARIARAMIRQAKMVTVIADASKLDRTALFQVCDLNEINNLVTEKQPPPRLAEALAGASVNVVVTRAT